MRLGIDIGGTKTDAVAVADSGEILERVRVSTGYGPTSVVATAVTVITRVSELVRVPAREFATIGIGVPGLVDADRGEVRHAVNLGLERLGLRDAVADALAVRVRVENDVTAAALGAHHQLGERASLAYLNLGTGLAAGLVLRGRLWRGVHGTAGEIGHVPVDPAGIVCSCGQRGCLETVASGSAIARQWPTEHPYPAAELFDAADAGDPRARRVRASFVVGAAAAVRMLALSADVETVVIGGGLSNLGDRLLADIRDVLCTWSSTSEFLRSLSLTERVQLVPPGYPVAAVGAALIGAS